VGLQIPGTTSMDYTPRFPGTDSPSWGESPARFLCERGEAWAPIAAAAGHLEHSRD
jgi:hypothetical protein